MPKPTTDYTERRVIVEGPTAKIECSEWGDLRGVLTCWRTKRNGGKEYLIINFSKLTKEDLACIGQQVREALETKANTDWGLTQDCLNLVTGKGG